MTDPFLAPCDHSGLLDEHMQPIYKFAYECFICRGGIVDELRRALTRAINWAECGPPPDPGHHCGPEAGCDGACADWAHWCQEMSELRKLAPLCPPTAEKASDDK